MDFNRGGHHMPRNVPPYGPNGFKFPPPPPFMMNDNLSNYTNFNQYGGMVQQPMNMTDASCLPPIGVFWDIENCNIPRGKSASAAAQAIRHRFFCKYREAEFVVVCDITKESEQVVKELEDAQVDLKHVSAKSKNACDEKLRQAMRRFSDTHSAPAAIILISSDVNFVTDLSDFKNRKKIHIILIHNERCADALIMAANEHYNFKQLLEPIAARREQLKDPTTEIIVTNLPANPDLTKVHMRLKTLSENTGGKIKELTETFALLSFATFESASRACKRMDGEDIFGNKIIAAIRHPSDDPKVGQPKNPYWANENSYNKEMFHQPYNQAHGYQGNQAPPNFYGPSGGFKNYEKSAGKNYFGIEEISEQTSAFEKNVRGKGKKDQIETKQNLKTDLPKDKDINEKTAEKLKKDEKICCLHDKRNIKEGFPPLPNVMVTLEKFTGDVMNLLDSHNNNVPLISFYECYKSLCGPLDTDDKGIPLEHLITCLDHVNIVVNNGNKVVKTMLKHVIPKDEKFFKSSTTALPNSLVHLSSELMDLIRLQPSGQLPLHQLLGRYQSLFKKEIKLSDYGYSSMAKLMEAMSDLFQILGANDKKIIMISHKEQLKRFYKALILVLDRQPSRVLYETSIPTELEKLGQPFKPVDYGLCYFQDLLISVSDALHIYMSGSDRIICKKDNDGNHFSQNEVDGSKALLTPNLISFPLEEISEQSTKFEELRGSAKKKEKKQKPKVEIQKSKEPENSPGLLSVFKKLFVDESTSNPERVGTLSKSSSTASIPSDETFCSKHSNESSLNNNEIFRIFIDLKTFSLNVNVLLTSHEKGIPLKSFVDCYSDMFGSLKSNETGVALEHLLTCIDYVKLVQKNGVKYIVKTSEKIKHIDTENFITGIEMNKLSNFGHEAIMLLQNQNKMEIPFDQFVCAYHQHFDKQLKLADFGVSKFATLISHLQNYIQVMGEGTNKVLTVTHVFNVRQFFIELSELLEAQSTKSLLSSKFLQEYNKTYGKIFDARNFGLCYLDDILGCLSGFVTVLPLKKDKMICFNADSNLGDMVLVSPLVIEQKLNILSNQMLNLVYPYYPIGLRLDTLLLKHQLKYGSMLKAEFQQCSNLEGFVNSLPSVKVIEFSKNKVVVPKNGRLFEKVFKIIDALIHSPGGKLNQKDFNDLLSRNQITLQSVNDFISMVPDAIEVHTGKETVYSLTFPYLFVRAVNMIVLKFGDATVQAMPLPTLEEKYFQLFKKKIEPSKYGFRTLRQLLSAFPRYFSATDHTLFYYIIENERKQVYVSQTSEDSKDGAQNKNGQKGKANKTPNKPATPQGGTQSVPKPLVAPTQPNQKNQNVQTKKPAVKASKVTKHSPGVKAGENVAKPHKQIKPHVKKPTQNSSKSGSN